MRDVVNDRASALSLAAIRAAEQRPHGTGAVLKSTLDTAEELMLAGAEHQWLSGSTVQTGTRWQDRHNGSR